MIPAAVVAGSAVTGAVLAPVLVVAGVTGEDFLVWISHHIFQQQDLLQQELPRAQPRQE